MANINVAFWNVQNLFEPPVARTLKRGPRTVRERTAKLDLLASVINRFFNGQGPDLLALAEVGGRPMLDDLIGRLNGTFSWRVWEDSPFAQQTGLGIIGRDSRIASLTLLDQWRPVIGARPRILLVEGAIVGVARPIWLAVNHWKSRMPNPNPNGLTDWQDREAGARWLGNRLTRGGAAPCVIMLGDLNCEPIEPPLNNLSLNGVRHATTAIYSRTAACTLYNSAWRFWIDPDPWQYPRANYRASRPRTTFGASGPAVIFDQLLVSKDALLGRPLSLREDTIHYHPDARVYRHVRGGHIRPWPWTGKAGTYTGASDHLPLLAAFDIL
jgi:endonuclease/exonuclease/phosphatase family metal-dependent hydrolase